MGVAKFHVLRFSREVGIQISWRCPNVEFNVMMVVIESYDVDNLRPLAPGLLAWCSDGGGDGGGGGIRCGWPSRRARPAPT